MYMVADQIARFLNYEVIIMPLIWLPQAPTCYTQSFIFTFSVKASVSGQLFENEIPIEEAPVPVLSTLNTGACIVHTWHDKSGHYDCGRFTSVQALSCLWQET